MVETGGTLIGEMKNIRHMPEKTQMTQDILKSNWPAVTEPSPDDIDQRPFEADAIIANPPVFGHIHVAEALGIPLHIMFPQPWYYGTRDYPHPLIGLPYDKKSDSNVRSYAGFEGVVWSSMELMMNAYRRKVLNIPVLHFGMGASTLIPDARISFSAMWSPAFVPKPEDWPKQCRVVGTFIDKKISTASMKVDFDITPFKGLLQWLDDGPTPVFVGFGSMVIADPSKLADMIMSAAEKAQCRVIVQSSWSKLDVTASDRCHMVGPCPHDWLLPQTSAVIHHGGAGTTAAGLRWGLPTFICPFFGDQQMWGAMVARAGVGPTPCPVGDLTDVVLAEKFQELLSPDTIANAKKMSNAMNKEDGIQGGLDHFLEDLPRDNLLCDVSLLLGEAKVAKYDVWGRFMYHVALTPEKGMKVSTEVVAVLKGWGDGPTEEVTSMNPFRKWLQNHKAVGGLRFRRHAVTTYALGRVRDFRGGCIASICGFIRHLGLALFQVFYKPDVWARKNGLLGCFCGFLATPLFIVNEIIRAFIVLVDRFLTGIANGCCNKERISTIDGRREVHVHETGKTIPAEVSKKIAQGISPQRKKEIFRAGEMVFVAKLVFLESSPHFPEDHWHYKVVSASALTNRLKIDGKRLKLNYEGELDTLLKLLEEKGDNAISFSMFLLFLHHAIQSASVKPRPVGSSMRSPLHIFKSEEKPSSWYSEMFGNPREGRRGSVATPHGLEDISEGLQGESDEESREFSGNPSKGLKGSVKVSFELEDISEQSQCESYKESSYTC